jgi:heme/copper-type cytochrome/quinol oxidase subunit 2
VGKSRESAISLWSSQDASVKSAKTQNEMTIAIIIVIIIIIIITLSLIIITMRL